MRIKLYGRVIGIFLKKHSFINVLISLQLIAVFVIGIIMTSIIDERLPHMRLSNRCLMARDCIVVDIF